MVESKESTGMTVGASVLAFFQAFFMLGTRVKVVSVVLV